MFDVETRRWVATCSFSTFAYVVSWLTLLSHDNACLACVSLALVPRG